MRSVLLAFALVMSQIVGCQGARATCEPAPTRSADAMRLLRFPIGRPAVAASLATCVDDPEDPRASFARATYLTLAGDYTEAIAVLRRPSMRGHDDGRLLLADLLADMGGQPGSKEAIDIYRGLGSSVASAAEQGLDLATLHDSADPEERRKAVVGLEDRIRSEGAPIEARLGAALLSTARNDAERRSGRDHLERAAGAGSAAALIELAGMASARTPDLDQGRAVELLERAVASGSAEAEVALAMLMKDGWNYPPKVTMPLFARVKQEADEVFRATGDPGADPEATGRARTHLLEEERRLNEQLSLHRDVERARTLLLASAGQGYLPAVVALGTLSAFHARDDAEFEQGTQLLEEASARGSAPAAERLAVLHEFGMPGLTDERATGLYSFAAERGSARAQLALLRLQGADRWRKEESELGGIVAALLPGRLPSSGKVTTYSRGLPTGSPTFAAHRWSIVKVRAEDGRQVFGATLYEGDRLLLRWGETVEIIRLGDPDSGEPLGSFMDPAGVALTAPVPRDPFAPAFFRLTVERRIEVAGPTRLPDSHVVLRALDGPEDAIVLHDPSDERFRLGTEPLATSPYTEATSRLDAPTELVVPDLGRVAAVVEGGTEFQVLVDGRSVLTGHVPDGLRLYLDFAPRQMAGRLRLNLPPPGTATPNEIDREWDGAPGPGLEADGEAIGWFYSKYASKADGLMAAMVEMNASVLAMQAEARGEFARSLRLRTAERHLALARYGAVSMETFRAGAMMAEPLARLGRLDDAGKAAEEAVRGLEAFDATPSTFLVDALMEAGSLASRRGDLGHAIYYARQALALSSTLPADDGATRGFPSALYRQSIHRLAELYVAAGDPDRADTYWRRLVALDLLDDPEEVTTGDMSAYVGFAEAEAGEGHASASLIAAGHVIPHAKADAGQRDKADPLVLPIELPSAVSQVFGPASKSSVVGSALLRMGEAYWFGRRPWSHDEPILEGALDAGLGSTGPGTDLTVRAAARLALVRRLMGKDDRNLEMLVHAVGLDDPAAPGALGTLSHDVRDLFLSAYFQTLDWYASERGMEERARLSAAVGMFSALEAVDPFARSFEVARLRRRASTPAQSAAFETWAAATSDADHASRQLNAIVGGQLKGTLRELEEARARSASAAVRASEASAVLATTLPATGAPQSGEALLRAVQDRLTDDEVVLDLLPTRYSVHALVITRTGARLASSPTSNVEVLHAIARMRAALDFPPNADGSPAPANYALVDASALGAVRPFTLDLLGQDVAKGGLVVIAHGALSDIPFEAIPLAQATPIDVADVGRHPELWPGLSKRVAYLPGLSTLLELRSDAATSSAPFPVAVVADPIMADDVRATSSIAGHLAAAQDWFARTQWRLGRWLGGVHLQPVPETATFGRHVLSQLGGDLAQFHAGLGARRSEILKARSLERSRVILFATHGLAADVDPNTPEPLLVLTPPEGDPETFDPLTASEISTLRLDADLVVLSACDTAASDGTPGRNGFSGLAQSLIDAGARSIVVTQWEVRTNVTQIVIERTFAAALGGADPAEALRLGRLAAAARFGHPALWSPFVYIGDPRHHWALRS
ncbi:CHAT domain-containing protein [Lichenibacterium dinghuense]|uniref:CHAT domain-containing protein n=1 Tax=Lichenibacterium dinghuense TaxID=2895977 RepID=UPI001F45B7AC|nr:CHAT domain-containing protein [Lichenibacterium sp. 6Y81]